MSRRSISFVATSRSGLGHLRRVATIAKAVKIRSPESELQLVTNAQADNLPGGDFTVFSDVIVAERIDMAKAIDSIDSDTAVLDTISVPHIEACQQRLMLILRETPSHQLHHFSLASLRRWDNVLIPNPAAHWCPELPGDFANNVNAVGWIYRRSGKRRTNQNSAGIVIATGGGGNPKTQQALYPLIDSLLCKIRKQSNVPFKVRQAIGPRAQPGGSLSEADEVFDPGPELHQIFRQADLVISTAGYNSVLELATTDTPAMLVAISRTYDNQARRAEQWGPLLGCCLLEHSTEMASNWLINQIDTPRRRKPVDLGPSGEDVAAKLILGVE